MKKYWNFQRRVTRLTLAGLALLIPAFGTEKQADANSLIGYELVGQVLNTSPQQSLQYGYLSFVRGLARITTSPETISENTALLTFYNDTATERVINNGPVRIIDRTGTSTIYFDSGNGDFSSPDTFRKGKPVQVCDLRHQVVIDTSTGYFTATFEMSITSTKTFQIDGNTYLLGKRGGVYRIMVYGKLTQQAPPSAHIAGVAMGIEAEVIEVD